MNLGNCIDLRTLHVSPAFACAPIYIPIAAQHGFVVSNLRGTKQKANGPTAKIIAFLRRQIEPVDFPTIEAGAKTGHAQIGVALYRMSTRTGKVERTGVEGKYLYWLKR